MSNILKGYLYRGENREWIVQFGKQDYALHPDDIECLLELERRFDFIDGRIYDSPIVEFQLVDKIKLSGIATYAKLVNP